MKRAKAKIAASILSLVSLVGCEHFSSLDRGVSSLPTMSFDSSAVPGRSLFWAPSSGDMAGSQGGCSACAH